MFNWHAALGCFSFIGVFVSAALSIASFESNDQEIGAVFLIVCMFLVFVSGGIIFA
jgi:hypothetical protein